MKRQKRRRSKYVAISFFVTMAVLVLATAALYSFQQLTPIGHLPTDIPQYTAVWAKYVPEDALQMSFQNFSMIRAANSSLPPKNIILQVGYPKATVNNTQVDYFLSVVLQGNGLNNSIDFAFMKPADYLTLSASVQSTARTNYTEGSAKLYYVLDSVPSPPVYGWMALIPGDSAVAFSAGQGTAKTAITRCLAAATGSSVSIASRLDIRQMLYIVGGATNHYALGIQNFTGVVRTGQITLISIDNASNGIAISYIVGFHDSATAVAQVPAFERAYPGASNVRVLDSYVAGTEHQPISELEGASRFVG